MAQWSPKCFPRGSRIVRVGPSRPAGLPTAVAIGLTLALCLASACSGGSTTEASSGSTAAQKPPGVPDVTRPPERCAPDAVWCNTAKEHGLGADFNYGRGVAFADIDGNGYEDIFVSDTDGRIHGDAFGVSHFYLNQGDGTFKRADLGLNPNDLFATWGASFGDFNNDGQPDLLIVNGGYTTSSSVALYENQMKESGKFVSVTDSSGVGAALANRRPWWSGSWADYDNDGWVDFVVVARNQPIHIFHNNHDATFTDVTEALGATQPHGDGHNCIWFDMDNDGDLDLFVADASVTEFSSRLYENRVNQGGGFVDVTKDRLPPIGTPDPDKPVVFSAAVEDFNQDGFDDIYLGRWTFQDLVLVNDGTGHFTAHGRDVGIDMKVSYNTIRFEVSGPEETENTMGLAVGDHDNDGDPDVFIGTGDPSTPNLDIVLCDVIDPTNPAGFHFERCSQPFIDGQGKTRGHGAAFADTNNDGATDIFWAFGGHPNWDSAHAGYDSREDNAFYENRSDAGKHTASISLHGKVSTDAFGARLKIVTDGRTRYQTLRPLQGFNSQNSPTLVVDTGTSSEAAIEISWQGGGTTQLTVHAGTLTTVHQDGDISSVPRAR